MMMRTMLAAVLATTALSFAPMAAAAQAARASASPATGGTPTVVLVHGAWADGSSWSKVIPLLQAKGIRVMGVQNPLTSLADDVTATQRVLADIEGPVVLVGHSWAGTVITEAGNDPKVKALVYVAAFANKEGQSGGDLVGAYPKSPALGTVWDDGHGFLRQTEQGMIDNFAPDLPRAEARTLFVTQGPLAASTFGDKVTRVAWRTVPSWYIVSGNDRVISPQMERDLAAQMKARTTVLASSHVSLLSHPVEVARVIAEAVASIAAPK
ncbi:alpha/beta fold hydrolase [Sphingomonas morindae]|uniref:Alpha/beta hydrolase n=1 Tax=Sphingomonas morindae TaxID=1541170 RepID=A0ABY4X844_9SPHN|nr:alpha/beta hydrolase [Sphingomonas morindae]USI72846.1 alpha/beta hydrolase [Sphingomonas morindae]